MTLTARAGLAAALVAAGCGAPAPLCGQELAVSGQVLDASGRALELVPVRLFPYPPSYARWLSDLKLTPAETAVATAYSHAGGKFRIALPEPGIWRLVVGEDTAASFAVSIDLLPALESMELDPVSLPAAHDLAVHVLGEDGEGIAGALAIADPILDPVRLHRRAWARVGRRTAITGAGGEARLRVPAGERWVRASARGLLLWEVQTAEQHVTLTLRSGLLRTLVVRHHDRRPARDALVRMGEAAVPIGTTDEHGRMVVATHREASISYQLETAAREYASVELAPPGGEAAEIAVDPEQPAEIVVALEPPVSVRGRVIDAATSRPLPGALIWSPMRPEDHTRSTGEGSFGLEAWSHSGGDGEELVVLHFEAAGYLRASRPLGVAELGTAAEVAVALQPADARSGTVVDSAGTPISGVRLVASPLDGQERFEAEPVEAKSQGDGRFTLAPLVRGVWHQVIWEKQGYAPGTVELSPAVGGEPAPPLVIELSRGQRAWGLVVDEAERRLSGAIVTLAPELVLGPDAPRLALSQPGRELVGRSDESGRFEISELAAGLYQLKVVRPGFAPASVPGLELPAGEGEVELGTVVLSPGALVEGYVTDRSGNALEGAEVRRVELSASVVYGPDRDPPAAISDAAGYFRLVDLRAGDSILLHFRRAGFAPAHLRDVPVPTLEPLSVSLEPSARIVGRVIDGEGRAVPGAHVRLLQAGIDPRLLVLPSEPGTTDEQGRFEIADLPSGRHLLSVFAQGFRSAGPDPVEVPSGGEVSLEVILEPGVTLSGRVYDSDGQPLGGATIVLSRTRVGSSASSMHTIILTEPDGSYFLEGQAPGAVSLVASHPDYREQTRSLELRVGKSTLDFHLEAGFEISGWVVDPAGQPLAGARVRAWPTGDARGLMTNEGVLSNSEG